MDNVIIPKHVGIIMDGNGRWANIRGLPRVEGHRQGVRRSKDVINASVDIGIKALTLYAFSIENWRRPQTEVLTLMDLLEMYLKTEIDDLMSKGIAFKVIGNREKLPPEIQFLIRNAEFLTSLNTSMVLSMAISYGGRDEIVRTVRKLANSGVDLRNADESVLESNLDTRDMLPVDLIIRTGGEKRISNFLIWQSAYAELYFSDTLWPDFTQDEFFSAIHNYKQRERRFGAVPQKVSL
ncbi:polyprenyl diphosphate synthase [Candidatus Magnetobacterium casense]|uniref:polyprenyl diphosphate synthase n=1 Tax=Candidatus Magnetobacterium casense TaxID=1455061 RepID=UPI00058F5EF4|nr:polyprenyl diphosphate synthase [Candidatus Magnetobacterium casensis]